MLIVGLSMLAILNDIKPIWSLGLTDEEVSELVIAQQENQDMSTLAGILAGIGFLLVLISFGAQRKRVAGLTKTQDIPVSQ